MGGGGGLPVGGGLLAKASLYGVVRLSDDFGLALEAGLAGAPRGDFRAAYASAGLVWAIDGPSVGGVPARPARNDFSAGVERYEAARRGRDARAVTTDVLKIERFVAPNVYLAGKVQSAFAGDAGGYSAALVGAGWWQPLGQSGTLPPSCSAAQRVAAASTATAPSFNRCSPSAASSRPRSPCASVRAASRPCTARSGRRRSTSR
jgi:hypothetical protein